MTIFSLPTFCYSPPPPLTSVAHFSPTYLRFMGAHAGGCKSRRSPPPPLGGLFTTFSPCGSLSATIFSLLGTYFHHVGVFFSPLGFFLSLYRALSLIFLHVGVFCLHFHPYWDFFLPCGGLFVTFFFLLGTCFTMWWHFCYFFLYLGGFLYIWGHLGFAPPPQTTIPGGPRVPIATPHHIIMPAITV